MTTDHLPLTDGVVVLRAPVSPEVVDLVGGRLEDEVVFAVEADGAVAGAVKLRDVGESTGDLWWGLYPIGRGQGYASRAVRLLVDYAFGQLGVARVQARVDVADAASIRIARRAGLRNEGVIRTGAGGHDYALLGRLREDPPVTHGGGFRALLNSFLPRKRVIAQALVRDRDGRVLLCHPTYKEDWDLPGGVVEVGESPREAVGREVDEELALTLPVGALVLTDWLPPWGGWDDALCLVFDGGAHDRDILDHIVLQARELRAAQFCSPAQVQERCADFTARRVDAALTALAASGPGYSESGRTTTIAWASYQMSHVGEALRHAAGDATYDAEKSPGKGPRREVNEFW